MQEVWSKSCRFAYVPWLGGFGELEIWYTYAVVLSFRCRGALQSGS